MSSEVRVVECIGTPGAGKTTAAAVLRDVLRGRGVDAVTMVEAARLRDPLLWQVYRFAGWRAARRLREGALLRHVRASEAARPLPEAAKRHTLGWFERLVGRLAFLRRAAAPGTVLVLDDGPLHRAVALHASPREQVDPAAVAAFVDLLEAPALAVHVRASVATCAARVHRRGLWAHRADWTEEDLDRYLANAAAVVEAAVARARERGFAVVDVDNDGDEQAMRAAVAEAADALLEGSVRG